MPPNAVTGAVLFMLEANQRGARGAVKGRLAAGGSGAGPLAAGGLGADDDFDGAAAHLLGDGFGHLGEGEAVGDDGGEIQLAGV